MRTLVSPLISRTYSRMNQRCSRHVRALFQIEDLEARVVMSLLGQQLFPSNSPWNQQIASAPVASNSTAIINNITTKYGDGRLHPDFGQDTPSNNPLYGIPFNIVHGNSQANVEVVVDAYPDESDLQSAPIPSNAVLEGDMQNGPTLGIDNRGDSHLIIYDVDNNIAYEFYRASRPGENSDGKWHADQETVWDMKTNNFRPLGWTSADAAGLAILPGLVRPDEGLPVGQGGQGVINHAIRFTLQNSIILNQFLYPASHNANSGNTNASVQPPMGARFRLKASVDISSLNPESQIIAQALKTYGMILADNGSNFFFSGASYSVDASNHFSLTWNDNDIQDSTHGLKSLHFSDFEVVNLTPTVTSLSTTSGAAGSTLTITGQNFTGAAGHLQILIGNNLATNVTVVDDSHVSAVVPSGSGTVDVRVQSGVVAGQDSSNFTSPIFGYGLSSVTSADKFTYGTPTNQPPTVSTTASASPNPVSAKSTQLNVLGSDDGGEANLVYTWIATTKPSGSSLHYSSNGTNASKSTTVAFDRAGSYVFVVTITDPSGLNVTSSANVTVIQTLTTLSVKPAVVTLNNGATKQFVGVSYDQFGVKMTLQPPVTWSIVQGIGRINTGGVYSAPKTGTGQAIVKGSSGSIAGTATVTVRSRSIPGVRTRSRRFRQQSASRLRSILTLSPRWTHHR
jgi:hypothetical protein